MYDLCKEDLRINFHTMRTGIFYGSTTGMTESLAAKIAARTGVAQTDVRNVADGSADEAEGYDLLLLGSSTWGCGELQDDWYDFLDALKRKALSGKRVALFGCGDSASYPDSFCDALAEIRDGLEASGCTFVGALDAGEYDGCTSRICRDGKVIGLAVDDGDVVTLLAQEVGRCDAEQARAEYHHVHHHSPIDTLHARTAARVAAPPVLGT